ncbi:transcription termination factor MTERF8, chloroplastic-like [Macadamia integrifolia]|uniref:transcription termination factor MTERF8, chloroplastic-like n=1 Tax=Macadamia integrifolia TaxID=60698 RepID=UPI001C52F9B5|nr:transcription termination factor MTERF8, chloroplastic-like [Macadamia integrifolia]
MVFIHVLYYVDFRIIFLALPRVWNWRRSNPTSIGEEPPLRFATLESVRSRLRYLQLAGIDGFSLCRLIAKRPKILTAEQIGVVICFLMDDLKGQIEPVTLERLLNFTEIQFFVGFAGKVELLFNQGIAKEEIPHVLNNIHLKVFCHKPAEEIERAILYLNHFDGVDLIVRRPPLLNLDLETQLIPRTMILTELSGGDQSATGAVLRKLPSVLTYSTEHLRSHVEVFRSSVGLTDPEIFKIVLLYPNVFSVSKDRRLRLRVEFLKQCGLNSVCSGSSSKHHCFLACPSKRTSL